MIRHTTRTKGADGYSQHDEREREPCDEVDAECAPELRRVVVAGENAGAWDVEGGER